MNKLKIAIISVFALVGVLSFVPNLAYASPADTILNGAGQVSDDTGCKDDKGATIPCPTLPERAKTITDVLLFALGAIAVIMIIIGGIRYVISGGDSSAVTGAKNTILYAVIGLVVAVLAYAIVNFVISSFGK